MPRRMNEKKLITMSTVEDFLASVGRLPSLGMGMPSAISPSRYAASASSSDQPTARSSSLISLFDRPAPTRPRTYAASEFVSMSSFPNQRKLPFRQRRASDTRQRPLKALHDYSIEGRSMLRSPM